MKENGTYREPLYLGKAPKELVERAERLRKERLDRMREELVAETENARFRYYCSACLIIRDENEYLEEWLRWHIGQGVEHFYIYDHGSKQPVREFLQTLDNVITDRVTVTEWKGRHADAQPDAYNDCLSRRRGESRWIAFIDTDEQIRVKTGQTLPEFLKGYESYAGVMAVWVTYDAGGQIKKTEGLLRDRFTHASKKALVAGKTVVQAMFMEDMYIHNGKAKESFYVVDEHRNAINDYALTPDVPTDDLICVDHYYTKSYEEWMAKLLRGSSHAKYQRKYEEFFLVNTDMKHCRENIRLVQKYERFADDTGKGENLCTDSEP